MQLTDIDLVYWTAGFLGHLVLLFVLCHRERVRRFPIFATWIISNLVRSVALALVAHFGGRAAYYYSYWSLAIVDMAVQFGIVYEMYSRTFRPLGVWAKDVRGAFAWLLTSSLVIAAVLTDMARPHTRLWIQEVTIRGNLFTSAWMSELFVGMVVLCVRAGLPWKSHVARIVHGLGIYSLIGVVIEAGNSYFGLDRNLSAYTVLSRLRMTVYLLCLLYWSLTLWRNPPDTRELSTELHEHLAKLQATAEHDLQAIRTWRYR